MNEHSPLTPSQQLRSKQPPQQSSYGLSFPRRRRALVGAEEKGAPEGAKAWFGPCMRVSPIDHHYLRRKRGTGYAGVRVGEPTPCNSWLLLGRAPSKWHYMPPTVEPLVLMAWH